MSAASQNHLVDVEH